MAGRGRVLSAAPAQIRIGRGLAHVGCVGRSDEENQEAVAQQPKLARPRVWREAAGASELPERTVHGVCGLVCEGGFWIKVFEVVAVLDGEVDEGDDVEQGQPTAVVLDPGQLQTVVVETQHDGRTAVLRRDLASDTGGVGRGMGHGRLQHIGANVGVCCRPVWRN